MQMTSKNIFKTQTSNTDKQMLYKFNLYKAGKQANTYAVKGSTVVPGIRQRQGRSSQHLSEH